MKLMVMPALCWFAALVCLPVHGQPLVNWMEAAHGAQHLVIPRYTEPDKSLYAVISIDKVYTEYEKMGFFSIGSMPMAVLEGVTYEAREPAAAAKNLAHLRSWLGGDAGIHVELRGVKLVASPT